MDIKEIQDKVKEYFNEGNFKIWNKFAILVRLYEELAEIGRIISVEEGLRERWKVDNMDYIDEFGDAFFQLVHLANQCNINLEEALKHVFEKYKKYIENRK